MYLDHVYLLIRRLHPAIANVSAIQAKDRSLTFTITGPAENEAEILAMVRKSDPSFRPRDFVFHYAYAVQA